jgi:hypothetical protein
VLREMRLTHGASPFTYICLWLTLLDGGLRRSNRVGFDEAFVGWFAVRGACPQPAAALRTVSNAARVCRGVGRRNSRFVNRSHCRIGRGGTTVEGYVSEALREPLDRSRAPPPAARMSPQWCVGECASGAALQLAGPLGLARGASASSFWVGQNAALCSRRLMLFTHCCLGLSSV